MISSRYTVFVLVFTTLTGCLGAQKPDDKPPQRHFIDMPSFVSNAQGPWVLDSPMPITDREMRFVRRDGVQAIELRGNQTPYVVAQDTSANLFLTPYLRWLWHVDDPGQVQHPVRLVIGFLTGKPGPTGKQPTAVGSLAPADRLLLINWGTSALQRGAFQPPTTQQSIPQYTMRGGAEHSGKWWPETVDLAKLYRRSWPGDDLSTVRLSFIGFAVEGAKGDTAARFSAIGLMK